MILLKRLAVVILGCATYRIFIKLVMTCCNAHHITVSEGGINRLKRLQNNALRLITGAVKTTFIDAVLSHTNETPMQYEIMKSALKFYQKLIRLPYSDMWVEFGPSRLKTQDCFLQAVLRDGWTW
ncbi:hypothetical protein NPIL_143841 [Nephila pilipes]|uniref:Uncharacterized protein n=1 Tax=Nephila pilipes TaxID=299642 RepID=A0A8X6MPE0_NEPPI|nr:hypothetical protein NPIL_143841 [Nephila pilipes]